MMLEDRDPFAAVMLPPPGETNDQRLEREAAERDAVIISNRIDEQIKAEKAALKKQKKPVKVLILGQSESGKSTTIKNFQLTCDSKDWAIERQGWTIVIHLNLIRTVNRLVDLLGPELSRISPFHNPNDLDPEDVPTRPPILTETHDALCTRLEPLRAAQRSLERLLGAASSEAKDQSKVGPESSAEHVFDKPDPLGASGRNSVEFTMAPSNSGWKGVLERVKAMTPVEGRRSSSRPGTSDGNFKTLNRAHVRLAQDVAGQLDDLREDIISLWTDKSVQAVLRETGTRLEESPGFFLDDTSRIASRTYEPSDQDVVRARLRTMGVQEYRFVPPKDTSRGSGVISMSDGPQEWVMYDVAGTRTSRAKWFPLFAEVNAIIFLAPISCFDETLAEDSRVNRIRDSLQLWKAVLKSKELESSQVILFLNKCDLLRKKIDKSGIKVRDFVVEFKDRLNDYETVANYFLQAFRDSMKRHAPQRTFYAHFTSVVDTKLTSVTLGKVQEGILRTYLKEGGLL